MEAEQDFWERCWNSEEKERLKQYLKKYDGQVNDVISCLKEHGVRYVCDAACGFGAYSLMLASNGFSVAGFDVAEKAVQIACDLLSEYHIDTGRYIVSDIGNIGFPSGEFDAATAHSVLDHLTFSMAEKALDELFRIVRSGGLVFISFDGLEEEDIRMEHEVLEDGSMRYLSGEREGMIFKHYSEEDITKLCKNRRIIFRRIKEDGERFLILQK